MDPEKDIIGLNNGDKKTMILVFNLYHRGLYYFAKQIINNEEQAEDIVADAFIKLGQKNTDLNELVAVKCFLYQTVTVSCLNYLRHLPAEEQPAQKIIDTIDENFIDSKMIKAELLQTLSTEIENLPPIRQKIFKMFFLEGLSIFEIAEKLQVTIDTVRVQKAKAMHSICSEK